MTITENKPRVLALPGPALRAEMFTPEAEQALANLADVTWNETGENWTSDQLAAAISGYDGLITGWGTPKITPGVLAAADRLRIIAHSAGTVKHMVDEEVLRQVKVSSASIAMSPAVAECALTMVMLGLRYLHEYDYGMRRGGHLWDGQHEYGAPREIAGSTIGVVGAGGVGRIFIGQATALGATVLVHDPYLSDADADAMGATKMDLDALMAASPIVVNVAPVTPETHHMIGAKQLALMPDNGYLVNPGRSWTVDQDAMLAELQSGRLRAALDVYDEEPLPLDHPLRALPNVLLLPHIAGATVEARHRQGDCVVRDLTNMFEGKPLAHEVTLERYAILA
jgi:phosphoglycerate dehydrogenase-like enzyme